LHYRNTLSLGFTKHPNGIPSGFDTSNDVTAQGTVELPIHVWWSESKRVFDLTKANERLRAYELVLTVGDEDDIRLYISFDVLRSSWQQLFLPRHVREAWEKKYQQLSSNS
jgi:hypothetical protein